MNAKIKYLRKKTYRAKRKVLEMVCRTGMGHLSSAFSCAEILTVLYYEVMRIDVDAPDSALRDRLIISKNHASVMQYPILADLGFFQEEELETFLSPVTGQAHYFGSHAKLSIPGVDFAGGSLGIGLGAAAGIAYALKIQGRRGQVYVLAGDGEMNEGTMWEAALFAASEKLDNLTLIIDDNASLKEMLDIGDFKKKLEVFGFDSVCADGHDEEELYRAIVRPHADKPAVVVARTRRGYGSHILMEDRSWFHRAPDNEELERLIQDVRDFGEEMTH